LNPNLFELSSEMLKRFVVAALAHRRGEAISSAYISFSDWKIFAGTTGTQLFEIRRAYSSSWTWRYSERHAWISFWPEQCEEMERLYEAWIVSKMFA